MKGARRSLRRCGGAFACLLALGCVSVPPGTAHETIDDPAAERLHRLCEHVVLYYAAQQALPPDADALREAFGAALPPCTSPRSGEDYSFPPGAVAIAGRPGRLLLYDPAPAMIGGRRCLWGILVSESPGMHGLVTQVVPLGEREVAEALRVR
ncbi:MAG TPA: hypothetical protein DCM87_12510 [Planctomycetes bacterium]|nr:hypothetical protein [Planctomycetota bacterium]